MDGLYVADEKGIIFKKYSPEDALDLVLVTGLEIARWKAKSRVLSPGAGRVCQRAQG